eukprot:scaffold170217_cov15-Tisochrysis_lutea.AAC.1
MAAPCSHGMCRCGQRCVRAPMDCTLSCVCVCAPLMDCSSYCVCHIVAPEECVVMNSCWLKAQLCGSPFSRSLACFVARHHSSHAKHHFSKKKMEDDSGAGEVHS